MKNERGFTLMEMVIALGVIAIIGSLLVSSIVTINANTKTADLMSFLDGVTREAREVFSVNPEKVITNSFSPTDVSLYPYTDMAYQAKSENEIHYMQSYTDNLHDTTIGGANEKYRMDIAFYGTNSSNIPSGFSFKTKTFKMEASVFENINGVLKKEPLYSKHYVFDNITVSSFPTVGEVKKITFQGNGGCVVKHAGDSACLGTSKQKDYFKGDSLYSIGLDGTPIYSGYKKDNLFIGWSLNSSDRNLLGNEHKIEKDTSVYAQYLAKNQYRLEFHISGNERFNVAGITGAAATTPYYVEKTSTKKPTISGMENNISRFFVKNAVRKNGYRFDYWEDANHNKVNPDTIMNKQYMILYPHFTPLDDGNQEMLSLNLTLNLNNVSAGKTNSIDRLYALYPFTKMEYSLKYNKADDSFDIIQKEIMNKDYGTLTGVKKGTVMSTKTFNTKKDGNFYFGVGNMKYKTFTEYVKASLDNPKHSFSIADVRLKVDMPTFTLGDYYTSTTAKDALRANGTGITLDQKTAASLFANPEASAAFTFKDNLPLDTASLTAVNDKIADITHNVGTFYNIGSVSFASSASTAYDSYTKKGKPTTTYIVDEHIRQYNIYVAIPLSNLGKMIDKNNQDILSKKGGIHVSNVKVWVDTIWQHQNAINFSFDLKFGDGSPAVANPGGSPTVIVRTGIPYIADQGKKDPDGNELYTYNKLASINFTIDGWDGYNGAKNGFGKVSLDDLHIDSYDVAYKYMDASGGIENDLTSRYHYGKTGWFPLGAVYGGYQYNYSNLYENDRKFFDDNIDIDSVVQPLNTDHLKARSLQGQWWNALNNQYNSNYNVCGHAYWQTGLDPNPSDPANSYIGFHSPKQISPSCFIEGDITNKAKGRVFSLQPYEPGNITYNIPVVTPGVDINVISFSKPGSTQNYLPPFISNVPYDK